MYWFITIIFSRLLFQKSMTNWRNWGRFGCIYLCTTVSLKVTLLLDEVKLSRIDALLVLFRELRWLWDILSLNICRVQLTIFIWKKIQEIIDHRSFIKFRYSENARKWFYVMISALASKMGQIKKMKAQLYFVVW